MKLQIWYLYHSGFAVQTHSHTLIFDYYKDNPTILNGKSGLERGAILPHELIEQNVIVFASHCHADHYTPQIFHWRESLPTIRYVLSDDIKTTESATFLHGGQVVDLGDLQVQTLESTDEGVAFLVKVDGVCIYHAGDLNWWHWEGEPEEENRSMAVRYCQQIDHLRGEKIDLAFLPVDPRLEKDYLRGLDYFMRTVGADCAVPIHLWGDESILPRLLADPQTLPYRCHVHAG